jgi:dephospho-CoA kinase
MRHPKTAALTGGIASGKSTVSRMFQELGAYVLDADVVARQVVEPEQPAWREIVAHFGREILLADGHLDRKRLGAIVFQQPDERRILERIIHPRVIEHINHQEHLLHQTEHDRIIIVDVPLLIEASMHTDYATVIVVYASEATQLQRLMSREQLSEYSARQRLAAQMPLSEKLNYATHIISNDGTLAQTQQQVQAIYQEMLNVEC